MREVLVPDFERIYSGIVKRGETIAQNAGPGAEGNLHDDGTI
jgi:hypothetical protein